MVLKQIFISYFPMYFYSSNLGPPGPGHFGLWDLGLNKLGKGPQGNSTNLFQAYEASGYEDDF